ncbi:MAG: acyltransferase [Microthrixaceae bacterium]|jgi:peptidoglycan/LPS O-acetylase OafA/YrhL|nr:acyltransferase [Microthrixaceae bacterium]HMT62111.1 acyltransferase [Microthrixaceae bacterium]
MRNRAERVRRATGAVKVDSGAPPAPRKTESVDCDGPRTISPARIVPSLGHIPELDGLRGVAVLLVVEYHVVLGRVHTLSTGLDLFFILSGFLITTLLAEEHDRHGRVSLPDFFRRRGLRLLPALFAYIAANLLMALAGHAGVPTLEGVWDLRTVTVESAAAVFYIYPALLAVWPNTAALRMPHLHSLGQEEWFYAFWAPTFARMMRRDRVRRGITIVIVVLAVIALARLLGVIDANPALVGPLRPDMMFLGAVIALGRRRYLTLATPQLDRLRRRVGIASALGTAGFAVSIAAGGLEGRRVAIAVVTATKLFAVFPIMLVLVAAPSHPLRRALRASWLQWFGRVSYGLYLWHSTVLFWVNGGAERVPGTEEIIQHRPTWLLHLAGFGGGTALAWLSFRLIEARFIAMGRRNQEDTRTSKRSALPIQLP